MGETSEKTDVEGKLPEDDKENHTAVFVEEKEEPLSEEVDESDVEGKLADDDKGNHTEIMFVEKLEPVVEGKLPEDDVGNHTEMIAANETIIFDYPEEDKDLPVIEGKL